MVGTVTRRWRPSAGQKACLESTFAAHNMPGTPEINQLAVALGLAPRQVSARTQTGVRAHHGRAACAWRAAPA